VRQRLLGGAHLQEQFLGAAADSKLPAPVAEVPFDLAAEARDGVGVRLSPLTGSKFLTIPIVVLAASRQPDDIQRCYSLHANAYIVKPSDFDGFAQAIQQIAGCFLGLMTLPP
jgi:DNA-binding NarL/FixJ family response regulator